MNGGCCVNGSLSVLIGILTFTDISKQQRSREDAVHECPDYKTAGLNSCYFNKTYTSLWITYTISVVAQNALGSKSSDPMFVDVAYIDCFIIIIPYRGGYHGASPYAMGLTSMAAYKYPIATGIGCHTGIGGVVQYPKGFLKEAYRLVRERGGVCIADETIEEDGLQQNSAQVGTYLLTELAKLRDKFDIIGDVRGKGLLIGVEMVKDKVSREPLPGVEMNEIFEDCKDMGLLIGKGGVYGQTFRIKPPMCITKDDADFALAVFSLAIQRQMERRL
ncbi:Alanine--glyoxylate aminotransferase 2, mitochondrial [Acipenser ruthenus]|uniref:Alanine--glyoxylate aminotransferase 2, mitochondrial n=1 Tax=Acipenser ruthenus TaxID=7906 RepID=A0A662YM25_ACIRT|nr:Alanine--glyoxylate aminotransferase 2, mitochondrial [Acipenser ruthenus]